MEVRTELRDACIEQASRIGDPWLGMTREDAALEARVRTWLAAPRQAFRLSLVTKSPQAVRVPHQQACLLVAEADDAEKLPRKVRAMAKDYVAATSLLDLMTMARVEREEIAALQTLMSASGSAALAHRLRSVSAFWDAVARFAAVRIEHGFPFAWALMEEHVEFDRIEELRNLGERGHGRIEDAIGCRPAASKTLDSISAMVRRQGMDGNDMKAKAHVAASVAARQRMIGEGAATLDGMLRNPG